MLVDGRAHKILNFYDLNSLISFEQWVKDSLTIYADDEKISDDNLKVLITRSQKKNFVTNFLTRNLGINKSHLSISIVKKIPKNTDGKILYSNLQNLIT